MKQTIVITGASDGIGAAAARQLAAQGEEVVLVGRSPAKTEAVARALGARYYTADFADLSQPACPLTLPPCDPPPGARPRAAGAMTACRATRLT